MPDESQVPNEGQIPEEGTIPETKAPAKPKGYLSTTRGKLVVGAVALLFSFIVAMALAFILLLRQAPSVEKVTSQPTEKTTGTKEKAQTTTPSTTPTSPTSATTNQPSPLPGPPEAYQYKDPFRPLITAQPAGTTTTGTTSTTTSATTTTATTATTDGLPITLISIPAGGGTALFRYGPSLYTVKAGQRIGASPYQVLSIGPSSVTLLYGDDRIELDLGEQMTH